MFKKILALCVLFSILVVTESIAGPFGLEKGMSLKDIGGQPVKASNGVYKLSTVPKPHSSFETYAVKVAPKGGLCWIKAIGKDIATSVYGVQLKRAFHEMEEKLASIYGKHKTMDRLMPGSIWDESNDWMMALVKQERILMAVWEESEGSTLPSDIKQIGLIASPLSTNKGYIAIEYSFINKETCDAELAAQEDDAL